MSSEQLFSMILDAQNKSMEMLIEMQIQQTALAQTLATLDPRATEIFSRNMESERNRHRERLEQSLKNAALLKQAVSKLVQ